MPGAPTPTGDAEPPERHVETGGQDPEGLPAPADRERAAAALRAAFSRLAPQGSDSWNFQAAFTHLGDRYGPYHPGASALSDTVESETRRAARRTGRLDRLRDRAARERPGAGPEGAATELEEAMGHVVEAFRFLSARVATLEQRLAYEDRPVDGAAWLVPARELGPWVRPVAAHLLAGNPGGAVVHADCGEGALLRALSDGGAEAHGVEPRGAVALRALERGSTVTIGEALEHLERSAEGSLGGIVLSGVVDRLPLTGLLPLLAQCRRTLGRRAHLVVLSRPADGPVPSEGPARDLVAGRPLHEATWALLLARAGFVEVMPLRGGAGDDDRLAVAAVTPS